MQFGGESLFLEFYLCHRKRDMEMEKRLEGCSPPKSMLKYKREEEVLGFDGNFHRSPPQGRGHVCCEVPRGGDSQPRQDDRRSLGEPEGGYRTLFGGIPDR